MADQEAQPPAPEAAVEQEDETPTEPEKQPSEEQKQPATEGEQSTGERPQQQEEGEPQTQATEGEGEQAPPQEAEGGQPPAEEPAQQEEVGAAPAEEQEGAGEKGEGEAGEEQGEKKEEDKKEEEEKKEEEKQPEEEPIVISPEGSPHWLSTEDVLAKGVPEAEVEKFKPFHFRMAYHMQTWYEALKEHTFQTEFLTLTSEEVDVLLAAAHPGQAEGPELSEEQKEVITKLEERIGQAIELFENDGAFISINTKSGKDAILERSDAHFVAELRDAVINELEVQKQSANAYAIWQDHQHHDGIIRRGIKSIRRSFRRSRGDSTSRREGAARAKLEEEKKEEGKTEPDGEAKPEGGEAKAEGGEQPPAQQEGEAEPASQTVTVEATIEGEQEPKTEDKPQQEEAAPSEPPAQPSEGESQPQTTEEPQPQAEPQPEEPPKEEKKEEEGEKKEEEGEKKEGEKEEEEGEKKEGEGEKKEGEGGKKEEEIQKTEEEPKKKPQSPEKKSGEHHHLSHRAKTEPLDNKVLRAFGKTVSERCRVMNGKEAVALLLGSVRVKQELTQFKAFGVVEGLQVVVSVCRWQPHVPRHSGMLFRGFVYKNELNALSQYNDTTYYPNVADYKTTIQHKVCDFYNEHLREALKEHENYIVDFFISPDKVYIVRLNPFYTGMGACLFTWTENAKVLTQGPFDFRIVEEPKKAPECFSSLQSEWQNMLDSVLQQRREERRHAARKCTIL